MKEIFINEKGNYSIVGNPVIFFILALIAHVLFANNRTKYVLFAISIVVAIHSLWEIKLTKKAIYDKTMNWTKDILVQKFEEAVLMGYITESLKQDIIYELQEVWDKVEIDGTFTPVQKGENVYLIVELRSNFLHEKITMRKLKE